MNGVVKFATIIEKLQSPANVKTKLHNSLKIKGTKIGPINAWK